MNRYLRLAAMMLAGGLPALGLYLGGIWAWVLVGLVALALVVGWPEVAALPQPHTARLVLALTAVVSIGLAAYWGTALDAATACLIALGVGFTAAMVRELARPAPRELLVRSVTGTASGIGLVSLLGLYLGSWAGGQTPAALAVVGACGVAAAVVLAGIGQGLDRWSWAVPLATSLGVLAGAGAGAAAANWLDLNWWIGGLLGGGVALVPTLLVWWLASPAKTWIKRLSNRDAAIAVLPAVVAAAPVWVAALIN